MKTLPEWKKNLAVMWFAQVAGMGAITGVFAFLPLYIRELGVTGVEETGVWAGVLMGAAPLAAALAGPHWGALGDRSGRKLMVERVMASFFLLMILMALVTDVYQLLVLRIVQGVFGGFTAAALALITSITPPEHITSALGIFQTAMIAGGAFGPMVGGILSDHFGFRWTFVAFGLFCLLSLVIIRVAVVEHFVPAPQTARQPIWREVTAIITTPGLGVMLAVQFLIQFSMMVIAPVLPLYVHALAPDITYIASVSGAIIAVAGLTSAIASAATGKLSKRVSHRMIMLTASSLAAVCFAAQAIAGNVAFFGALRGVSGLFLGAMLPTINAITFFLIPAGKQGVAYGVTTGAQQMGNVIGPLTGGVFAVYLGIPSVFWLSALLFAAVTAAIFWSGKTPGASRGKIST